MIFLLPYENIATLNPLAKKFKDKK